MKRKFGTLLTAAGLLLAPVSLTAGEIEKEPLNFAEITDLIAEEQVDRAQIEETEAGIQDGAGLFAAAVIGLIVIVAHSY